MSEYIVEGIRGIRSGRPFAYTRGDTFNYIDLGIETNKIEVNMPMALAQAVPLVAHTAIHYMINLGKHTHRQEEVNLNATLIFTNTLAPDKIRHPHDIHIFEKAGINDDDLSNPNGMLKTAVFTGLLWTVDHLKKIKKLKDIPIMVENLEQMYDMTMMLDEQYKFPAQFVVEHGILKKIK